MLASPSLLIAANVNYPIILLLLLFLYPGTGSGVGTRALEILKDEFPEVYRFTTAVFPSADDDVITSPYNRSTFHWDR